MSSIVIVVRRLNILVLAPVTVLGAGPRMLLVLVLALLLALLLLGPLSGLGAGLGLGLGLGLLIVVSAVAHAMAMVLVFLGMPVELIILHWRVVALPMAMLTLLVSILVGPRLLVIRACLLLLLTLQMVQSLAIISEVVVLTRTALTRVSLAFLMCLIGSLLLPLSVLIKAIPVALHGSDVTWSFDMPSGHRLSECTTNCVQLRRLVQPSRLVPPNYVAPMSVLVVMIPLTYVRVLTSGKLLLPVIACTVLVHLLLLLCMAIGAISMIPVFVLPVPVVME